MRLAFSDFQKIKSFLPLLKKCLSTLNIKKRSFILELVEVPWSHPIYQYPYPFPQGLPKIHEHDQKPPEGFGLFYEGRLVCFYSFQTDLGDGWEDPQVHKNPPERRLAALRFGANILSYVFLQPETKSPSP